MLSFKSKISLVLFELTVMSEKIQSIEKIFMLPMKYNSSLFTTAHKENDLCKPIHKCINLFTTTNIYLFTNNNIYLFTSMKYLLIYYTNIFFNHMFGTFIYLSL